MNRRAHPQYVPPRKGDKTIAYSALLLLDLPDCAKRVGGALVKHVNDRTGRLNPSEPRLMETTRLSKSGVQKGPRVLFERGIAKRLSEGKGTWSACYQINWNVLRDEMRAWEEKHMRAYGRKPPRNDIEADSRRHGGLPDDTQRLERVRPNTFQTLSKNSYERRPKRSLANPFPTVTLENSKRALQEEAPAIPPAFGVRMSISGGVHNTKAASREAEAKAEATLDEDLRCADHYEAVLEWLPTDLHQAAISAEQSVAHSGAKMVLKAYLQRNAEMNYLPSDAA